MGKEPKQQYSLVSHFAGKKRQMQPLFNSLKRKINSLGSDVKMGISKDYITFLRTKCFAVVYIGSKSIRIDFCAKENLTDGSLRPIANWRWSGRLNRHLKLAEAKDINKKSLNWLKSAYKMS